MVLKRLSVGRMQQTKRSMPAGMNDQIISHKEERAIVNNFLLRVESQNLENTVETAETALRFLREDVKGLPKRPSATSIATLLINRIIHFLAGASIDTEKLGRVFKVLRELQLIAMHPTNPEFADKVIAEKLSNSTELRDRFLDSDKTC